MIIQTDRLRLRPFENRDRLPFARMNADPEVMRYFPSPMTQQQSDEAFDRFAERYAANSFHFLAAELLADGRFIGFIGIGKIPEASRTDLNGQPEVEIGWRLDRQFWGKGLASEGAIACLDYAWQHLQLPEIVAFTSKNNVASRRVMEKIGMQRDAKDDFDHSALPVGHELKAHVLYRIANPT